MAIKGSLSEATLADVIQLLSYSMKAGCLSVTDGKNFGNIFIKDGKIIYATLLNRKDRLGNILVSRQKITPEQLDAALKAQKATKRRLGEILIESGAITHESLANELKSQIGETIFTMLTWESGYFNFEADLLPADEEITVQLLPQAVLLEGARRIDEWRKIENKIPPFETVFSVKGDLADVPLTEQERKIVALIDGTRSIDDILKSSEYEFFETCRTIYGLISAGLLEKQEKTLAPKKKTGDVNEYKNLGFAFFKTEMFDEAEREFNKIIEIDPDNAEALLYCALIDVKRSDYEHARMLLEKAAAIEKRPSILNNLGFVYHKLGMTDAAIASLSSARDMFGANARVSCNLGLSYFKKGELAQAEAVFLEGIAKFPEFVTPYLYLSLIYIKNGEAKKAASILNESVGKFPRVSMLKNNLAVLLESMDRPEDAERFYRQAMDDNPGNQQLARNLADFYYEAQILGAARELYERITGDNVDWEVLFKLGNIHLRQGEAEAALDFWEKAHQLNPEQTIVAKNIEVLKKSRESPGAA